MFFRIRNRIRSFLSCIDYARQKRFQQKVGGKDRISRNSVNLPLSNFAGRFRRLPAKFISIYNTAFWIKHIRIRWKQLQSEQDSYLTDFGFPKSLLRLIPFCLLKRIVNIMWFSRTWPYPNQISLMKKFGLKRS